MKTIVDEFTPNNINDWELWLNKNHSSSKNIWLVHYKKNTDKYNLSYSEALDLALCYGWIDSVINKIDDERYKRLFSKRRPNSCWSKVNKEKISILLEKGLIKESGLIAMEIAKSNGSYYIIDDAENEIIPDNLKLAFEKNKQAVNKFESLSTQKRKSILRSLSLVKTQESKNKKIEKIIKYLLL